MIMIQQKMKVMISLATNWIVVVLFFLTVSIPGIGYMFSGSGNFEQNYFGRYDLISGANKFRYHILQDKMFTGLIANQNGWLMLTKDGLIDHQRNRAFSDREREILKRKLRGMCSILSKQDIYFVLFVTPNKNTIYSEQIPSQIMVMDSISNLDVVKKVWKETENCTFLDIRGKLIDQKTIENVYYKTDTHWNRSGAFIGYQALMEQLAKKFPVIVPHIRSEFRMIQTKYYGDLTRVNFGGLAVSEETGRFSPTGNLEFFGRKFETLDTKDEFYVTFNDDQSLPSAIFYHDSFIYNMRQFLTDGFRETQQFRGTSIDFEYIKFKKPDVVILEITERFLRRLLTLPVDV